MPLLAALLAWVGPLIARILLTLGFSVVTFTGMELVISQMRTMLADSGEQMGQTLLSLFIIVGGSQGVAIILGAINTRVALWVAQKGTKILGG